MKKSLQEKIQKAQVYLKQNRIDAWVIYQFIDRNEFFDNFIEEKIIASRRTFLVIPNNDSPKLIHSGVDGGFSDLRINELTYHSYDEFLTLTKEVLSKFKVIAMEYSPQSKIPHISKVDAGIIDVVKSLGIDVISSGNLLQEVGGLNDQQVDSHLKAAVLLDEIRKDAISEVESNLRKGKEVSEYSIQQAILRITAEKNMETIYEPEININANAARPHYLPTKDNSLPFKKGDLLLIDMWAKLKETGSIYADITWMFYRGYKLPTKIENAFNSALRGRDTAVKLLEKRIKKGEPVYGWEVDKAARDSINADGYGEYFTHRLGHSLGTFVHGNLVHFDNYENIDDRQIMNNHLGTIEPGVYIPGEFGIRSEINLLVKNNSVQVTTSKQESMYFITY